MSKRKIFSPMKYKAECANRHIAYFCSRYSPLVLIEIVRCVECGERFVTMHRNTEKNSGGGVFDVTRIKHIT